MTRIIPFYSDVSNHNGRVAPFIVGLVSNYMTRLFTAWGRAGKGWRKEKAGELGRCHYLWQWR